MNGRGKPRKDYVTVSGLAAYAADPDRYIALKGGPADPEAAQYGTEYHEGFIKPTPLSYKVVLCLITLLFSALALVYLL